VALLACVTTAEPLVCELTYTASWSQGEHLMKREEIYQWWRPATGHGGDRRSEDFKTTNCRLVPAFTEDTAAKTGIDRVEAIRCRHASVLYGHMPRQIP